jgi:hypothetical protein
MIKHIYKDTFYFFLEKIKLENINWALTGSYRLYLESNQYFNASDIDILTDKTGARLINAIFDDWVINEFRYSESNGISSFFGQLQINNIVFDVMSNVQNRINGKWSGVPNLDIIDYIKIENYNVPVLPLSIEYELSKSLNQSLKNLRIKEIMNIKNGLQQSVICNAGFSGF